MGNDLVGSAEIAAMLGVSRQRVDQLASAEGFPRPIADLSAGRIWARSAVEAWMAGQGSRAPAADLEEGIASALGDSLRRVLVGAQETARKMRHPFVGTEHLLLALLSTDGLTDVVAAAARLKISKEAAETAVSEAVPPGSTDVHGPIAFTPRSYKSLSLARGLADAEGHPSIEPRHLLTALARESDGVAARVMTELSGQEKDLLGAALEIALKDEQGRSPVESTPQGEWKCNFCGKGQQRVKKLIAGPGIFICDGCIGLCNDILRDEGLAPQPPLAEAADRLDGLAAELEELRKLLGESK